MKSGIPALQIQIVVVDIRYCGGRGYGAKANAAQQAQHDDFFHLTACWQYLIGKLGHLEVEVKLSRDPGATGNFEVRLSIVSTLEFVLAV